MTNLTFERAVEIAVNMTIVKEHPRQVHSPGGATVDASLNVNRVRFAPNQSEGRYPTWINYILVKDTLVMDISVTDISVTGHFGN